MPDTNSGHPAPAAWSPSDAAPVRVLIVDDSEAVRTGLCLLLGSRTCCEVVGAVDDFDSVMEIAHAARPHVVLLDFSMPNVDPFALIGELSASVSRPAVLMLSAFASEQSTSRAVAAGAAGWVLKDAEPDMLVAALLRAARSAEAGWDSGRGDAVVDAALAHGAGGRPDAGADGPGAVEATSTCDPRTVRAILRALHHVPAGATAEEVAASAVVPLRVAGRQLKRLEARPPGFVAAMSGDSLEPRYVLTPAGEGELERLERHDDGPDADARAEPCPV